MNFWTNAYIQQNTEILIIPFLISFTVALLVTPLIGKLAKLIGAVDLPASMRLKSDSSALSRINTEPKLKLGGLAILIGFLVAILIDGSWQSLNPGIILGLGVIIFAAFLDDRFELSGKTQLFAMVVAAALVVIFGISVTKISFLDTQISFDWISYLIKIGDFAYVFVFPADILTILWIVGIINVINWVGGVDALNPSISAIIAFTMMLFALQAGNTALAVIIIAHVGGLLGFIPYNYNPSKIIQGATGDLLNGYLLAIFAIIGGTTWTSTFILLALPILDAAIVVFLRLKSHPETRKNPLKLLSLSDTNHLHHRLLSVGYSRKTVLMIEITMMTIISAIAIYFSGIRRDFSAIVLVMTFLITVLAVVFFLKKRKEMESFSDRRAKDINKKPEPVVKVIFADQEKEEEEKFIY